MSILNEAKEKMKAAIEHLRHELKGIRTGHANPAILDGVMLDVYGTQMRLQDVSNVTTPEPRQLLVTPYDANNSAAIGKAIEKANLGFTPIVEGNLVRINVPQMDETVRKEMIKLCHKRQEEAKISIRNVRRDANEHARKQKTDGDIGEDDLKKIEKEIQDLTDKFCKEADQMASEKEKDIATI